MFFQINMTLGKINKRKILGLYSPSGVFELKKIYAERHEEFDPCCDDAFADVTYYLLIWRQFGLYLVDGIKNHSKALRKRKKSQKES